MGWKYDIHYNVQLCWLFVNWSTALCEEGCGKRHIIQICNRDRIGVYRKPG